MAIGDTVQAGLLRADFSPIQKAGQAQAQANQAFGQTLGGLVDKFYQKKKEKAEKEQLKQAYLKLGMSEEVADAAKNDKDLAGQFINKMNADRNYDLQMDQFNQVGQLRDLQKDQIAQNMARQEDADQLKDEKRMVDNQFMQSLMSQTTSPQAQRQADIAMPGLPALGNTDARNRFMQAQLQQPQNQVPVSNLGSQDFGRFAREQGLDPTRSVQRMEALRQAEQAVAKENTGKLGDQFSSRVGGLEPYFFSESDATNAVSNEATKLGINLNKDQLAQSVSKQKIISTKDLRSAADTRFSKLNLDEPRTVLEAADDLEAFLTEGNPLSSSVAKEKLARMVQPKGILTEDDLKRMGGSQAFIDRFQSFIEQQKTGTLDPKLKKYLEETTAVFRKRAQEVLMEKTDYTVKSLAKNFEITPEEVRKYTQFGGIMYGFDQPSNQDSQQGQTSQDPSVPQASTLPGGGIFTPIAP